MKYVVIAIIVIVGIVVLLILRVSGDHGSELTFARISEDMKSGAQLLDVRTSAEYAAGHIEGAKLLPLQDLQAGILPTVAKEKSVYVYCRSGNRSRQATKLLQSQGYSVVDLGAMTHVQTLGGTLVK